MPEATAILDFVVSQTWKCLSVPVTGKNKIFSNCFFDEEILSKTARDANIFFAPGLSSVMNASKPPGVKFFKSLPVKYLGVWGIYALVLEKKGHTTLVYIGEASHAEQGIRGRWRNYEKPKVYRKVLPRKVKEALDDGYKIVHKGVLAWFGIPSAKDVPRFRVLNYALECMFAFYFWTMFSKTKDYQIGSCCPWPRESFTYGGLCSHSSLNDPMKADLDLSAEQLELLSSQSVENRRSRQRLEKREHREANRDAKIYYCEVCELALDNEHELTEHKDGVRHKKRVAKLAAGVEFQHRCEPCGRSFETPYILEKHERGVRHAAVVKRIPADALPPPRPQRIVKKHPRRTKAEREAQTLYCHICDLSIKKPSVLILHNNSARHKKREADLAAGIEPDTEPVKLYCDVCDVSSKKPSEATKHNNSVRHKKRVAKVAAGGGYHHRCTICNKTFSTIHQLNTHKEKSARHKQNEAALKASV